MSSGVSEMKSYTIVVVVTLPLIKKRMGHRATTSSARVSSSGWGFCLCVGENLLRNMCHVAGWP